MKHSFLKVLGLMMVLALTLTGCNLIEIDARMQADEDIAKINKTYSAEVAAYEGGNVTADEVVGRFYENYNYMYYMYTYYFGSELTQDQVNSIVDETLSERVRSEIVAAKFDEGYELTEEELADVEKTAKDNYNSTLESALSNVEGKDDYTKNANADVYLTGLGMTYDQLYEAALLDKKVARMEEILKDEVTEVTSDEIQARFEKEVADDEALYFTGSNAFETAMSGTTTTVYWMPEGYRAVKHILFIPEDDVKAVYTDAVSALKSIQTEISDYENELAEAAADSEEEAGDETEAPRTAEEIQADLDSANAALADAQAAVDAAAQACIDNVSERMNECYAKLAEGADFDEMIAEYGEDPGMQKEPTASRGYYVSAESTKWETNFRDAAMALAECLDYTMEPVVSGSGVHIIQWSNKVESGAIEIDTVWDDLADTVLEEAKQNNQDETINGWIEERHPTYESSKFYSLLTNSSAK